MKTRIVALLILVCIIATIPVVAEEPQELVFENYYVILPEMDLRLDPQTPGKIDTVYAGTKVNVLRVEDMWAVFTYEKNGEIKTGCTWAGAIGQGVRIHLLEDAFLFHRPHYDLTVLGGISAWREPSDPDLIVLSEVHVYDGTDWLYVVSLDGRCGYMRREEKFEIVK